MSISAEAATQLDEVFDRIGRGGVPRDQWDRPRLIPGPKRAANPLLVDPRPKNDGRLPYTSMSTLANMVSDHSALHTWEMRSRTKGMGDSEDLCALAAALPPIIGNQRNKTSMTPGEIASDRLTNQTLDEIGEEASRRANRDFKASWGTAVHGFTDPGDHGPVPARMAGDVNSWFTSTQGWRIIATEQFCRNDELQAAGTFDHLVEIPWMPELGAMIVDKKTGILHPDQFSVQLYGYASGELYDQNTDEVKPWPVQPSTKWGILAHIPLGEQRTVFELVDLEEGRKGAHAAIAIRAHRSNKNLSKPFNPRERLVEHVLELIKQSDSTLTLDAVYREYQWAWTSALTAAGDSRWRELTS